ncbi:MAG: M48 family metallopeptidase [Chitinophagales bacterium]|nr:M48 family metallopeptidase [Chitinophagales bacterium]
MTNRVSYQIHPKEKLYFSTMLIFSLIMYAVIFGAIIISISKMSMWVMIPIVFYIVLIVSFIMLHWGILIGYLKGNAVKITEEQFPDIFNSVVKQAQQLEMESIPDVYLLQQGGLLNAFATRFLGTDYIVIYSDILEEAYESNRDSVEFVIAHELGHIKRKHLSKRLLLFPAMFIPFLGMAYSRACEYTCDNIGAAVSPKGTINGLVLLASGKKLYKKVNVRAFIEQNETEAGFWSWLAEKLSTHPKLTKRVAYQSKNKILSEAATSVNRIVQHESAYAYKPVAEVETQSANAEGGHNRYMPGL